jgi:hypothetical protein
MVRWTDTAIANGARRVQTGFRVIAVAGKCGQNNAIATGSAKPIGMGLAGRIQELTAGVAGAMVRPNGGST